MTLDARARVSPRNVEVGLTLEPGERLAVIGPNGSGKSTLLGVLAGTVRPDAGRATLDGRVLFDLDGPARQWTPASARRIGLLAQDPLLFPHLTASQNVAFGPRALGTPRRAAHQVGQHWLEVVEAQDLATRKPAELSGGQAQRVAIARALAAEPRLLLLDEPLASLDVDAAPLVRRVLRQVLAGRSAIVVTHDLLDALLLSERILVLDHGRIVEEGPTREVLRHPRTPFTARIAGLNLVVGVAEQLAIRSLGGVHLDGIPRTPLSAGEPAVAVFAPEAVSIFTECPHGSPRNVLPVTVTELEPRGDRVRVRATAPGGDSLTADVTPSAVSELDLYPGKAVFYAVKATTLTIYPS